VVGGMSAARRGREVAHRTGRCGRVVGMVGEVEADRASGDHARVPITLLGVGGMEVFVAGAIGGVRGGGTTGRARPRRAARPLSSVHRGLPVRTAPGEVFGQ